MFEKVLIANRGEIACRVIRTLRELGIRSVAVYSDADRGAKHVAMADEAVRIGPPPAHESYLDADAIIGAALASGAQAIHPGYGFLSENAEFADECGAAGIVFIGPGVTALGLMGDKIRAKQHVSKAGVPVIQGVSSPGLSNEQLETAAIELGFPILVKPSAGGGGKGMVPVLAASELTEALATARRIASSAFGDDTLLLERLVTAPRHIEVQLLADTHGNVIHLGERECSLQRRHQKVIEEAPSPLLSSETRARIGEAACTVARSVDYVGAGTVEFLVSADAPDEFFFMEMNTRLQVEHPVTELVTGIDLVAWQLRVAAGERLTIAQDDVVLTGHAIEARVYAEDPESGFLPSTGTVVALAEAGGEGVRVDSSLVEGLVVSPHYDPMLAKVIAWGSDRARALERLDGALAATTVLGVRTNLEYLRALLADADVRSGELDTTLIERRLPGLAFRHPDDALLAVAALYLHADREAAGGWHARDGWRVGGTVRPSRYRFALSSSDRADVFVSGSRATAGGVPTYTLTIGSETHSAVWSTASIGSRTTALVEFDGVSSRWAIARDSDILWLGQRGFSWPLGIVTRDAETAEMVAGIEMAEKPRRPEVRSPMPGTVVTVSVVDGAHVEPGDTILTVEAMKMEHKLTAPVAGIVSITATPGDLVKLDQLLASITVNKTQGAIMSHELTHSLTHGLTEDEQALADMVKDFADTVIAPASYEADRQHRLPMNIVAQMGEMGLFGLPVSEEYGGQGGSFLTLCLAIEAIARVDQSLAITLEAAVGLGVLPLYRHGTDEQKARWLPDLVAGRALAGFGLTEAEAGSDAGGTRTTARLDGDEWVINGSKQFITNSGTSISSFVSVAAVTGERVRADGSIAKEISTIIVPHGTPGFTVEPAYDKVGWWASDTHPLTFDEVRVPAENLLGERGRGFANFLEALDEGRVAIAALATGAAEGCLDEAIAYAKSRVVFGVPIASHQYIAFTIAKMRARVYTSRLAWYDAARRADAGLPFKAEAAMAKMVASDAAMQNARDATQIFGGYGFMNESLVGRHYRDSKILEIGEGTNEVQLMVIARSLGLGDTRTTSQAKVK